MVQLGNPSAGTFTPAWNDLKLGAGGQITGVSILNLTTAGVAADGTELIRTDTGGGYLYVPSGPSTCVLGGNTFAAPCWRQLFTTQSVPVADQTYQRFASGNVGVVEIVACQSNTNDGYALWNGALYVTTNLKSPSITWTKTIQTTTAASNNGNTKSNHPYIYCDPNNPNIVYYSTPSSGVFTSTSGLTCASLACWPQVTQVGTAASSQGHVFAVDPASPVVGGVTQHFWICTSGTGCYETINGGGNFTLLPGTPTGTFFGVFGDQFSQLWVIDTTHTLRMYDGTWHTQALPSGSGTGTFQSSFAIDPTVTVKANNHIVVAGENGLLAHSTNNGSSYTGYAANDQTYAASGAQPGWLGTASQGATKSNNTIAIQFDASGNLWDAGGISVWTTPAPVAIVATPWSANAVGIEQLVVNQIVVPPGNSPLTAVWDRGVYLNANPDIYPSVQYPNSTSIHQIQGAWGIDYAAVGTTNFVTAWIQSNVDSTKSPASSSDGGRTWTAWPTSPAAVFYGGNVAASTATNWITVPGRNEQIYFTTNAATTWTASTIAGSPTNWLANTNNGLAIAADRVTAGNFCAVTRSQTFYKSTDAGASFTATGAVAANVDGNANLAFLKSAPGQAGHYFYTAGGNGVATIIHLWKSTDTCANWTNINPNMFPVYNVGFGAHKPGAAGTYPTIYVNGFLSGVQGFYQSIDGGATWTAINVPAGQLVWPQTTADFVQDMEGDPDVYGRIYVGFNGTGAAYIDTADACPWVNFSNVNPKASLTGTVTLTAQHSGLVPVTGVQFSVDGANIGSVQTGQSSYSVSFNASAQTVGAHTLKVAATGVNCAASKSIPITTN